MIFIESQTPFATVASSKSDKYMYQTPQYHTDNTKLLHGTPELLKEVKNVTFRLWLQSEVSVSVTVTVSRFQRFFSMPKNAKRALMNYTSKNFLYLRFEHRHRCRSRLFNHQSI